MKYPPIDKEKVKMLIGEIQESIARLSKFSGIAAEEFKRDKDNYAVAEHHLRRALEGVLSLGTHILSRIPGGAKARDYTEVLLSLGKFNVLPSDFAQKIRQMAGYRNRLVHLYWEVTDEEMLEKIKDRLDDFDMFCKYILEYVKKQSNEK